MQDKKGSKFNNALILVNKDNPIDDKTGNLIDYKNTGVLMDKTMEDVFATSDAVRLQLVIIYMFVALSHSDE